MSLLYKLSKLERTFTDGRKDPANGKWFAKAITLGMKEIDDIAEQCSYSTTVTKADCKAVLEALSTVIKDYLQSSYSVRIPGLGIFKIGIKSTGADEVTEFSVSSNIKASHVNFLPEYTVDSATGNRFCALLNGLKYQETPKNAVGV